MKLTEAIALIRAAVGSESGAWADLGAGTGTFTEALAVILGRSGSVVAVDHDANAVTALQALAHADGSRASVTAAVGDLAKLDAIVELQGTELDGALFANSLHYVPDPTYVLTSAGTLIRPGGRVVIVEYDQDRSNRWVPYPLSAERLQRVVEQAGLRSFDVVARRPSAYQGEMYCAIAFVPDGRHNREGNESGMSG